MTRLAFRLWESTIPLLFPPVCVLCGAPTAKSTGGDSARRYAAFCRICETSLQQSGPLMRTACERCGWPRGAAPGRTIAPAAGTAQRGGELGSDASAAGLLPCPRCRIRKRPHRFERMTPLYRYHDAARDAVVAAKYPRNSAVARELGVALAQRCRMRWPDLSPDLSPGKAASAGAAATGCLVTSVPSPWLRQLRRGGSGARLLAQFTATALGLPYLSLLCTTRGVAKQALLDDQARRENVGGAFRVRSRYRQRIRGREVLLVDDVLTTGATADEIADVLLRAGARRVSLAVAALAIRETAQR